MKAILFLHLKKVFLQFRRQILNLMRKPQIKTLFFLFLVTWYFTLPSCKKKNDDYPPRTWSEYSYINSTIPLRDISFIYYESDHSLWLGSKGNEGLLHYDGYKWSVIDKNSSGIDFDSITAIVRDGNNNLWVSWKFGLALFDGSKWQQMDECAGLNITSIAVEGIGNIRVGIKGKSGGIATMIDNEWKFETIQNSDIPSGNINALVSDPLQQLWLATYGKGIVRLINGEWQQMSSELQLLSQNFTTVVKAPDGSIWAGSENSQLIHFYNDTIVVLSTGTSKPVTSIVVTINGDVWCSTAGAGIVRFDGNTWTSFTTKNAALPSDDITYLTEASQGYLLFSTAGGKLNLIKQ